MTEDFIERMTAKEVPDTFYIWLKPISIGSNKCHKISEFKDGETALICYKNWNKSKNRWEYYTEEKWLVNHKIKGNDGADGKSEAL